MPSVKLTEDVVEAISQSIIKRILQGEEKQKKRERDWRLRNTKLLLKNYHILKEHCQKVSNELEAYEESVFDPEDIEIKSIMASKAKTRRMVLYIDEMILAYERYAMKSGDAAKRRYRALVHYYIHSNKPNYDDLSELLNVSQATARRDVEDARKEFSIFLFGLFAIEDLERTE